MTTTSDQRPAAWYPDPTGQHQHRWWDGERWTDQVGDAGVAATDAPRPPAPPAVPAAVPRRSGSRVGVAVAAAILLVAAAVAIAVLGGGGDDGPVPDGGGGGVGGGLAGNYLVEGTNPNGSAYRGTAEITGDGPTYTIEWVTGGTTSQGEGRLRGDTFEVTYTGALTGTGGATYELQDDGRLVGTWGRSGGGTETLIPQ